MPQVFGCPNCQNPFQVPDDAAGQAFQCPSCESTVEVPSIEKPNPSAAEPEIFGCPHCSGKFGIDASMHGQQLACPHCEELVSIGEPPAKEPEPVDPLPDDSDFSEQLQFEAIAESAGLAAATETSQQSDDVEANLNESGTEAEAEAEPDEVAPEETETAEEPAPPPEPVFEQQSVDHLLPPRFEVPDPVRFPSRLGSAEVILPDGQGGYQSVDANIVTITHNGEVYQLKRLTPDQRRRRKTIHNSIAIAVAVGLIYLTLRTLGLLS